MKLLGLDTTGESFSVAVVEGERCLAEISGTRPRCHLTYLTPAIELALRIAGVDLAQLDGVAVTVGPGSFTGVRLGVLTARTLALSRGLALAPVGTLEVQAMNCPFAEKVVVANDARRGEIYTATFDLQTGRPRELVAAAALEPNALRRRLEPGCLVVGSAPQRYPELFGEAKVMPPALSHPRAEAAARLGQDRLSSGNSVPWTELMPVYLRPAEVQVDK